MKYFSEVNTGGEAEKFNPVSTRACGHTGLRACGDSKIILRKNRFIRNRFTKYNRRMQPLKMEKQY